MEKDELELNLIELGVPADEVDNIISQIGELNKNKKTLNLVDALSQLRIYYENEKNPYNKAKIAAKIISLRMESDDY